MKHRGPARAVNPRAAARVAGELYVNTVDPSLQEAAMELQIARQIIETLAQGIHPLTGEAKIGRASCRERV